MKDLSQQYAGASQTPQHWRSAAEPAHQIIIIEVRERRHLTGSVATWMKSFPLLFFFLLSLSFTSCLCRGCLASCNVANVHRLDWSRRTLCGVDQNAACGQLGCWRLQNKFFFSECQATTPPACSLGCDGTRLDWTPPLALGTQTEHLGGRGLKFNSCKCCHLSGRPHLCRVALVGEGFQFVLAHRGSEPCISLSSFTLLSKVALESDYIFVVSLSFGSMNCILKHLERTK